MCHVVMNMTMISKDVEWVNSLIVVSQYGRILWREGEEWVPKAARKVVNKKGYKKLAYNKSRAHDEYLFTPPQIISSSFFLSHRFCLLFPLLLPFPHLLTLVNQIQRDKNDCLSLFSPWIIHGRKRGLKGMRHSQIKWFLTVFPKEGRMDVWSGGRRRRMEQRRN